MSRTCNYVAKYRQYGEDFERCKKLSEYMCTTCQKKRCGSHILQCKDCDSYLCDETTCKKHKCAKILRHRELMNKLNEITELLQALVYAPHGSKYQEANADFEEHKRG